MPSYYDIEEILAEEEQIPCTTCFDFAYLAWLDPDYSHFTYTRKRNHDGDSSSNRTRTLLPEGNKIQMPIWAIDKWSTLSFVRLSLPKHYTRKVRERLLADPIQAHVRMCNERYFISASFLVQLIGRCHTKIQADLRKASSRSSARKNIQRRNQHAQAIQALYNEAKDLRNDTLVLFSGTRLRCTLDWTMFTSMEEDVSQYTSRLTEMERQLFVAGAGASRALYEWKNYGGSSLGRRACPSDAVSKIGATTTSAMGAVPRAVSPDGNAHELMGAGAPKRVRMH